MIHNRYALSKNIIRKAAQAPAVRLCVLAGALLITIPSLSVPAHASSSDVYPSGASAPNNTDLNDIQAAFNAANPGDTVTLHGGDYYPSMHDGNNNLLLLGKNGRPGTGSWITVRAAPGEHPVLHLLGSSTCTGGFTISDCSYIRIDGLELAGNPQAAYGGIGSGDYQAQSHDIQIVNCTVHDFGCNGISGNGSQDLVEGNTVYGCCHVGVAGFSGIDFYEPVDHTGNNISFAADNNELGNPADGNGKQYSLVIRNNTVYNNQMQVNETGFNRPVDGQGIILDDFNRTQHPGTGLYGGKTLVANNVCYNNGGAGIISFHSSHLDIVNNTCYHNATNVSGACEISISQPDAQDINAYNNIAVAGGSSNDVNGFLVSDGATVYYDRNMSYSAANYTSAAHDRDGQNPLFVNAGFDFHLQPGSPAISGGQALWQINYDHDGNSRSTPFDIGAYQYQGIAAGKIYRLRAAWGGQYLTATNSTDGAMVDLQGLNTEWSSQEWYVESVSGNEYRLRNGWGGQYLTETNSAPGSDTDMQGLNTGWTSQEWYLELVSGNEYCLRNGWGSLYLNAAGTTDGSGVNVYTLNNTYLSEQWYLEDPPATPAGLTAVAGGTGTKKITVSWISVSGATGYKVYRSASPSGVYTFLGSVSNTNFVNTGLTAGVTYSYKVSAIESTAASGEGIPAGPVSAKAR